MLPERRLRCCPQNASYCDALAGVIFDGIRMYATGTPGETGIQLR